MAEIKPPKIVKERHRYPLVVDNDLWVMFMDKLDANNMRAQQVLQKAIERYLED